MFKVISLFVLLLVVFVVLLAALTAAVPAVGKFSALLGMAWGFFSMTRCMDIGYKRGWIK
nr:MAG: hypothetical protein [Bacteriophage sp.]